jgi:hypothetical protein
MPTDRSDRHHCPARRTFLKTVAAAGFGVLHASRWHADQVGFVPSEPANRLLGTCRGIRPGRVAWAHDPKAVS